MMRHVRNPRTLPIRTLVAALIITASPLLSQTPTTPLEVGPDIIWSTFIGGSGEDQAFGGFWGGQMRRGRDGTITTWMITTPEGSGGPHDLVCARFSADGRRLLWSTTIGGPGDELGGSIAVDPEGDVFVGGHTFGGLPTTPGAHQAAYAGGNGDGFLARLGGDGRIKWLTYVGGVGADEIIGVTLDPAGNLDVTLGTTSDGLATPGAYATTRSGDLIAQFTPEGVLRWATYSGGADLFGAICADRDGDVLVTGSASAPEFLATRCATDASRRGTDAVVLRFSSAGAFRWASCIGGSRIDWAGGVAIAPGGAIVIAGTTLSPDLPASPSAFQRRYAGGGWDGFVARLTTSGELEWLTYVGGAGEDWLGGLAVDRAGHVTVVGRTSSPDLRITSRAVQPVLRGDYDGLVLRFDSTGRILWSSYLGGLMPVDAYERIVALELDPSSVLLYGSTSCADFPTTPATVQPVYGGGRRDCFLTRLCLLTPTVTAATTVLCAGDSTVLRAPDGLVVRWSTGATAPSIVVRDSGRYWFEATDGTCSGWSDTVAVRLVPAPALAIVPAGPVALCGREPLELDAGAHATYLWSTGATTRRVRIASAGRYGVTVGDGGACTSTAWVEVLAAPPPAALAPANPSVCRGDSVLVEAPSGFVRYRWNTGASTRGVVARGGETLWAELVDSTGCVRTTDTVYVRLSVPEPLTIDGPVGRTICEGEVAALTVPPRAQIAWSTGDTTRTIRATRAGRYDVETVDWNGCHQKASFELSVMSAPRPRLSISGTATLCRGDTLELEVVGRYASVRWPDGSTGARLRVGAAGSYAACVIDSMGCSGFSDTVRVVLANPPHVSIAGPTLACTGEIIRFEVPMAPSVAHTWRCVNGTVIGDRVGPSVLVRFTAPGPGGVTVDALDTTTGCTSSAIRELLVAAGPRPVATALGPTRLCAGDSVELDAGGEYDEIRWSSGQTSRRIVVRESGVYTVSVRGAGGCTGVSEPITVAVSAPRVPGVSTAGDTLVATPALAYEWVRNGVVVPGATASRHVPARNGRYSVRALDTNGCWGISEARDVAFSASAIVVAPELSARPGEVVRIRLTLRSAVNLPQVEAGGCTAVLRFRSRMLLPLEDSLRGVIEGDERVVTIHGAFREGDSTLAELVATAALADTVATTIHIDRLEWDGVEIATTLRDGRLRIRPQGGWEALIDNGWLAMNEPVPNPTQDVVEISYTLIEEGHTRLVLYDAVGRMIAVLLDAHQVPGAFRVQHSMAGQPSGNYRFELTTPGGSESRAVRVAR